MKPETDWHPTAPLENLQARATILAAVRSFFAAHGVLEVETPVLSAAAATAPHLQSLSTQYTGPFAPHGRELFLQTSPEFPMKRLLAAGSGPIYQICKAFRNGEAGHLHNPEFTMLEWYRPGFDLPALMDEVEALAGRLLADVLIMPAERITYTQAFQRHASLDIQDAPLTALQGCAQAHGIAAVPGLDEQDRDAWLDLLLTHIIEPRLGQGGLCFIYDYPAAQAALARIRHYPPAPAVAERFELYVNGVELASGYHELLDGEEQRRRFERDQAIRRAAKIAAVPLDENLLAGLKEGLPDCAGVAVGMDRLVMLVLGVKDIREVLAFPVDRA